MDYDPNAALSGLPALGDGSADLAQDKAAMGQKPQNAFLGAVKSSLYDFSGGLGRAAQGVGAALGSQTISDAGKSFADAQQQLAEQAGRPDLEGNYSSLGGIGYNALKMATTLPLYIGGAGLASRSSLAGLVGERAAGMLGAGAVAFPGAVGGNIDEATKNGQPLTQHGAVSALALGVPEAAAQSFMPGSLERVLEKGAAGKLGQRLLSGAGINALVGGGQAGLTTALTQFMGDPDRPVADRARDVVNAAMSGGLMGGLVGGAIHGLRPRIDPSAGSNDDLKAATDPALTPAQGEQANTPKTGLDAVLAAHGQTSIEGGGEAPIYDPTTALREATGGEPAEPGTGLEDGAAPASGLPIDPNAELAPGAPVTPPPLPTVVDPVTKQPAPDFQSRFFTPDEMGARMPDTLEMRTALRKALGARAEPFIRDLNVTTEPELVNALKDKLNDFDEKGGALPAWFKGIAVDKGIIDDTGKARDPLKEQADLAQQAADMRAKADATYQEKMQGKPIADARAIGDDATAAKEAKKALDAKNSAFSKADVIDTQAKTLQDLVDLHKAADALPPREVVPDVVSNQSEGRVALWKQAKEFAASDDAAVAKAGDEAARRIESNNATITARNALARARKLAEAKTAPAEAPAVEKEPVDVDAQLRAADDTTQPQVAQEQPAVDVDAAERAAAIPETPAETEAALTQPGRHRVVENTEASPETQMLIRDKLTPQAASAPVETKSAAIKRQRQVKAAPAEPVVKPAPDKTPPVTKPAERAAWVDKQTDTLKRMAEPVARTQGDVNMEALVRNGAGANEILEHLAQHGDNDFVKSVARMMQRLGLKSTVGFKLHPNTRPEELQALGPKQELKATYDERTDHVHLISRNDLQNNVLHELVHAATHQAINNGNPVAARLETLRARLEKNLNAKGLELPYGLKDVHEFVAEAFSNKAFQTLLADQPALRKFSMWDTFKDAISTMLGRPGRARSMLDDVIQHGQTLMDAPRPGSISDTHDRVQVHARQADDAWQRQARMMRDEGLGKTSLSEKLRGEALGWNTLTHIRDFYGNVLGGLHDLVNGYKLKDAINARVSQKGLAARALVDEAVSRRPQVRDMLQKLMTYSANKIDPRRNWEAHTWLHDSKNADELHALVDKANKEYGTLRQLKGDGAYEGLVASNKADELAKQAHMLNSYGHFEFADQHIPEFEQHPMERFRLDQTGVHDDPFKAEAFWRAEVQRQLDATMRARDAISATAHTEEHTAAQAAAKTKLEKAKTALASLDAEQKALPRTASQAQKDQISSARKALKSQIDTLSDTSRTQVERGLDTLDELVRDVKAHSDMLDQSPYFHQGRYGKFFVSGHLNMGDGKINADHVDALQKLLSDNGFGQYALNRLGDNPSMFFKTETADQAADLHRLLTAAQAKGWLDNSKEVKAGLPGKADIFTAVAPRYLQRIMERTKASSAFTPTEGMSDDAAAALFKAQRHMAEEMSAQYLDALPTYASAKVYQHRENVQGFDKDMLRNFSHRSQVAANTLANLAANHTINKAMLSLNADVEKYKASGDVNKAIMAQQVMKEIAQREANRSLHIDTTWQDRARSVTHSFYLGASVSYMLEQLSQVSNLLLPELGKDHGFTKSAMTIGRVTGEAFGIMKALMASPKHRWDAVLTPDLLRAAHVSEDKIKLLMGVANRGGLDMNGFTREMLQAAGGEVAGTAKAMQGANKLLQKANATAIYAEMVSRVISVLAADRLHSGTGAAHEAYIDKVLSQSMMDWGSWNTSRKTGKHGVFGATTPLMLSFTGYQTRMIEKLYREVHTAIGGDTPEERTASRKFLAGHLAAATVLSGTLGLPAAAALSGVASNMANFLTGKDDFDVETSYREFLSSMIGKDLGKVVAKGLPTALGVDTSNLGDQNLLPFTKLLSDRRKLEESIPDWAKNSLGSPFGIGMNWMEGMRDMAYGLPLQGMAKMVPHGLKGPMDAARMAAFGYEDEHGRKLPITASAGDILTKAIGLEPEDKEEYADKSRKATAFKEMRSERAQFIRQRYELAMSHGDQQGVQDAVQAAQQYGMDHPQHQILPKLGALLQQDRIKSATAGALGLPLGIGQNEMEIANRLRSF